MTSINIANNLSTGNLSTGNLSTGNLSNNGIQDLDPGAPQPRASTYSRVLGGERSPILLPFSDCQIQPQVSLAKHTSYKVGGPAEWFVAPRTHDDLQASLQWAEDQGLPTTLLGAGSNLLVSDRGLTGLVLCTRHLRHVSFDDEAAQVTVFGGEQFPRLAWKVAERGWSGLEWAVGIPGTVGGAVVMNAGAHQFCTADVLINAQILTPTGQPQTLQPSNLHYRYRTSSLQGSPTRIVTQATFQLEAGYAPETILARTRVHKDHRHRTQPYHMPSCGSVFRNPTPKTAGWLIENTGLKGYQIGMAQVAQLHANFILNCGGANASDIFRLIRHVQAEVDHHWQMLLEPEVKMIGEFEFI